MGEIRNMGGMGQGAMGVVAEHTVASEGLPSALLLLDGVGFRGEGCEGSAANRAVHI